jgi:hypothetical protein
MQIDVGVPGDLNDVIERASFGFGRFRQVHGLQIDDGLMKMTYSPI